MSNKTLEDKNSKREARQLWEKARAAADAGDYKLLRQLDERVVALSPTSDHGQQAARELQGLTLDRGVFVAGMVTVLLYLLAWWVGLA